MSATQLMYLDAGSPDVEGSAPTPGVCCICASIDDQTIPAKKALKAGFSDYSILRAPSSHAVCRACVWTMSGIPPHTYRMWSTVYREDRQAETSPEKAPVSGPHTSLSNRGNCWPLIDVLGDPPESGRWFAAVAQSGQKHILIQTPVNLGGANRYRVRFDGVTITTDASEFRCVFTTVLALRRAGFSADDIASGRPNPARLTPETIPVWKEHADLLTRIHSGQLVELCLYLITKDVIENA